MGARESVGTDPILFHPHGRRLFPLQVTWDNSSALMSETGWTEHFCWIKLGWAGRISSGSPDGMGPSPCSRSHAGRQLFGGESRCPCRRDADGGEGEKGCQLSDLPPSRPAVGNPMRNLRDLIPQMSGFHLFFFGISRLLLKKKKLLPEYAAPWHLRCPLNIAGFFTSHPLK